MGETAGKPPAAPDPNTILALQNQYNRSNTSGPFGSQSWSTGGPGGHETLTTNLSPNMQGAVDRAFSAASTPYQKEYVPQGMDQLASAIMGRVGGRYGVQGMDTNLQHQKPAAGMSPQSPQGMGGGMSGMGIQTQQPGGQNQMGQMPAPGMTPLGGLMGQSQGGFTGGNPLAAMQALQGGGMPSMNMQQPGPMGPPQQMPMGMPNVNMQQPGQMPLQRQFG